MSHNLLQAKAHKPRLVLTHDVHDLVHGTGFMARVNAWLAVTLTKTVGTMWCAYFFVILALIALPGAIAGGLFTFIMWVSQTFIQLVMLSVIMVGQNVLQAASDQRAQADHETIVALKQINDRQLEILEAMNK